MAGRLRLPRTIRLDDSDQHVFEPAAEPGEWAVPGAFVFADMAPEALAGKTRQAFASGFLGTVSFGWSSLVVVAEIDAGEYEAAVADLARHFVERYGAPDRATALAAAREEVAFAASLCEHKINTLLAVRRSFGEAGITERFRVVEPGRPPAHARIWEIVDDEA